MSKNNQKVSNKRSKKANSKKAIPLKKTNISFAQKLGAFLLQGVKGNIVFSEETGFSDKHPGVFGVLPFLHMNIQEETFVAMLEKGSGGLKEIFNNKCKAKNLDEVLQKVDYDCEAQCDSGISALNQSILDSINNRYKIRDNGQKRLSQMLGFMTWQVHNNKIPKESLKWSK